MTSVLSDKQDRIVRHLVENELQGTRDHESESAEEYREELEQLLAKVEGER